MPKRCTSAERLRYYHYCVVRDRGEVCQHCGLSPQELRFPLEIDHIDEDEDNWDAPNLQLLCKACNVRKSRRLRSRNGASLRSAGSTGRKAYEDDSVRRLGTPVAPRSGVEAARDATEADFSSSPRNADGTRAEARQDMPEHPVSAPPRNGRGTPSEAWEKCGEGAFISNEVKRLYVTHPRAIKEGLGATEGTPQQRVNFYAEPRATEWILEQVRVHGVVLKDDLANGSAQITHTSPSTTRTYIDKLASSEGPLVAYKNIFGDLVITFKDSQLPMSGDAGEDGPQGRMPLDHEESEMSGSGRTGSRRPGLLGWLRGHMHDSRNEPREMGRSTPMRTHTVNHPTT